MTLEIDFNSRDKGCGETDVIAVCEIEVIRRVATSELHGVRSAAFRDLTKKELRRMIVEQIQPRAEFEAEFAKLRLVIQESPSISMGDQMRILGAVAELHEKLLLR